MANVSSSNGIEKRPKLQFSRSSRWQSTCLDCICNIKMGQSPDSLSYNSDSIGLPLVQGNADITDRVTTPTRFTSQPTKIAVEGDIIMSVRAPVGTVSVANQDVCCGRGVCSIRVKNNCLQEFLYQLLLLHEEDWRNVEQGGTFKAISGDDIRSFSVNIPSLSEQEKIASFLEKVDERIRIQKRIIETLKKYKRGVVKTLLDPKQNQRQGVIWTTDTIGNLGTFIKGAALSKADISDSGTPFILYGELYTTYKEVVRSVVRVTQASVDDIYRSKLGDVVIPTSGETPEEISTASCIMVPDVILAGDLNIYRSNIVDGRITSYLLNHIVNDQIARVAQGKSVVHVQASEVGKISITYPDHNEQERIAQILELIDNRIAKNECALDSMQKMKKAMLQQLFI